MTELPVAIVTGSNKGIGKYLSESLLRDGYLVVGCSRSPASWELPGYAHVQADVGVEEQVKSLLRFVRDRFNRLDVAINNAAIASMNHALLTPAESLNQMMRTNVQGSFLVAREAAKLMRKRRFGRIVNLTSVAVPMALAGEAVYAASKGAVETLTRVLSHELAEFGITVNAIGPGPIETDLIRNVPREQIQRIVDRLAVKRLGQPRDVYNVTQFLIKPESDYVTGQVIYLGG